MVRYLCLYEPFINHKLFVIFLRWMDVIFYWTDSNNLMLMQYIRVERTTTCFSWRIKRSWLHQHRAHKRLLNWKGRLSKLLQISPVSFSLDLKEFGRNFALVAKEKEVIEEVSRFVRKIYGGGSRYDCSIILIVPGTYLINLSHYQINIKKKKKVRFYKRRFRSYYKRVTLWRVLVRVQYQPY